MRTFGVRRAAKSSGGINPPKQKRISSSTARLSIHLGCGQTALPLADCFFIVIRADKTRVTFVPQPLASHAVFLGRRRIGFRMATWIFVPAQLALLAYACYSVNTVDLTPLEIFGQ